MEAVAATKTREARETMTRRIDGSRTVNRRGQRGVRWGLALGLMITLAALMLAGCDQLSAPSAASLLAKAQEHFNGAKTFHFVMTADHLGEKPAGDPGLESLQSAEGDVQRPDKVNASGTVNFGGLTVTTKMIIIGQQAWYQNPLTGSFDEEDSFASFATLFDPSKGLGVALTALRNPSLPSDGSANGTPCWKISGDVDTSTVGALLGSSVSSAKKPHATICIGKSDGRLYSIMIAGQLVPGDTDKTTRTIYLSKYDAPVNIQPPA